MARHDTRPSHLSMHSALRRLGHQLSAREGLRWDLSSSNLQSFPDAENRFILDGDVLQ